MGSRMSEETSSDLNSEQDLASIPTAQGGLSRLAIARLKSAGVPRHSDRHQIEFCMFAVLRICRMLTGLNFVPQHFWIAHHRSETNSEMARFVGTAVEFGATTDEFALDANARELPLIHADPYL